MKNLRTVLLFLGLLFLVSCGSSSSSGDGDGAVEEQSGGVTYVGTWDERGVIWTFTASTWGFSSASQNCEVSGTWEVADSNPWIATNMATVISSCPAAPAAPQVGSLPGTSTITVSSDNQTLTMTATDAAPFATGAIRVE